MRLSEAAEWFISTKKIINIFWKIPLPVDICKPSATELCTVVSFIEQQCKVQR